MVWRSTATTSSGKSSSPNPRPVPPFPNPALTSSLAITPLSSLTVDQGSTYQFNFTLSTTYPSGSTLRFNFP